MSEIDVRALYLHLRSLPASATPERFGADWLRSGPCDQRGARLAGRGDAAVGRLARFLRDDGVHDPLRERNLDAFAIEHVEHGEIDLRLDVALAVLRSRGSRS